MFCNKGDFETGAGTRKLSGWLLYSYGSLGMYVAVPSTYLFLALSIKNETVQLWL